MMDAYTWLMYAQLDVSDDGFLSLMTDDGTTKDDVKVPDGEVGDKINKLFTEEGKDTSKLRLDSFPCTILTCRQTSLPLLPWVRRLQLRPRSPPSLKLFSKKQGVECKQKTEGIATLFAYFVQSYSPVTSVAFSHANLH